MADSLYRSCGSVSPENNHRFESLLANASDIIVILDRQGTFCYVSPSAERILGYPPDEAVSRHLSTFVHEDDVQVVLQTLLSALAEPGISQPPVRYRVRHCNGNWNLLEAVTTNLLDDPSVGGVVVNCHDITAHEQAESWLRYHALYDALTALPNRRALADRLQLLLDRGQADFALLLLDLDRFKLVNSSHGHSTGDRLLQMIARRLISALPQQGTVARLGGDEFAVLVENVAQLNAVETVTQRVHEALSEPFMIDEMEIFASASVGVVFSRTGPGKPTYGHAEELLRDADIAMYRAKTLRQSHSVVFDPSMRDRAVARLQLENQLWRAIERGELEPYYQPVVCLKTGQIKSLEALVRWKHPQRGLISPAEFVPIAEESGAIGQIGEWVLEVTCHHLSRWNSGPRAGRPLTVAVNLSVQQLAQSGLAQHMRSICERAGIDPSWIGFEITESMMLDREDTISTTLGEFRKLGFRLSIDDFGTGYSSLSRLHQLPIDTLKIDRAFVAPIESDGRNVAIARTILALAESLNMDVVAEGIETVAQAQELRALGCQYGQGYWFSPPVSGACITPLLNHVFSLGDGGASPTNALPPEPNSEPNSELNSEPNSQLG
ncbi:MAG TPA: EAL domain-containing protein [Coleofasciculaceae cyanobacterium]